MRQPLDCAVCHSMGASVRYRVVGVPSLQAGMSPVEPNLEGSSVWFMREIGEAIFHRVGLRAVRTSIL
jgi:hypothetical protein